MHKDTFDTKEPRFKKILKDANRECDDYYQMLNRIDTYLEFYFSRHADCRPGANKLRAEISNLQIRHGRAQIVEANNISPKV